MNEKMYPPSFVIHVQHTGKDCQDGKLKVSFTGTSNDIGVIEIGLPFEG